jgi:hypothetical protein
MVCAPAVTTNKPPQSMLAYEDFRGVFIGRW